MEHGLWLVTLAATAMSIARPLEWFRLLFAPFIHLMNGLREVHANKLLHLDIKPANVYIAMDGRPVLLDFGAARITLSEEAMKLKPMYTAGFAARV